MGIPHLVKLLQPYATRDDLEFEGPVSWNVGSDHRRSHVDTEGSKMRRENAIIDGPGLAFHAFHRARSLRDVARNPLEAMPTYSEINSMAVKCLETLEVHGFLIAAVFFDGHLPFSKRDTRMDRLHSNLSQMEAFRALYSNGIVDIKPKDENVQPKLSVTPFSLVPLSPKSKGLPAPSFLVPSVIEHLLRSRFSGITKVIAAEADHFCASFAADRGGTVFTNDSDLLAYELGQEGNVLRFQDIELEWIDESSKLRVEKFETAFIAQRLNLKSLQPLAFAIQQDHHSGLISCLTRAQRLEKEPSMEYQDFMLQYALRSDHGLQGNKQVPEVLHRLDPRISEWICQMLALQGHLIMQEPLHIYLPFLLEDTTKASAWNMGRSIRHLAYSIISPPGTKNIVTSEYTRRGPGISNTLIEALDPSTFADLLSSWIGAWVTALAITSRRSNAWRLMGLITMCQSLRQEGKPLPSKNRMRTLLSGKTIERYWTFLHSSAQLQAAIYSWRLLAQVLVVLKTLSPDQAAQTQNLSSFLDKLSTVLDQIPTLEELFTSTMEDVTSETAIEKVEFNACIDTLYDMLDIQERPSDQPQPSKEPKSGKKNRRGQKAKAALRKNAEVRENAKTSTPSNMYDILMGEDQ